MSAVSCSQAHALLLASALFAGAGCITVEDPGPVVVLPPESVRFERFIEASSTLTADSVLIEAVTAYRKDMIPKANEDFHSKEVTRDRIRLVNLDARFANPPVSMQFRNLDIRARERIEVVFSDQPLLRGDDAPTVLTVIGKGVARLRGAGVDVIGERIVIRNDEVQAFLADGRPIPIEGGSGGSGGSPIAP